MTILLSQKASDQLAQLFEYLENKYSPAVRRKFQKRLDRFIAAIKLLPHGFPLSEIFPGCRKCVVSPQTSLIYRIEKEVIEIVAVIDNRQDR
ncbi:MAG TPA: type II toxin-antitoxin system RelE/ParE family toxin [Bacteroidetes bacterium]|nr:type II toxin-antitoxin system RelE/ParE family toxin [Bacteroidota bacterium]